MADPIATDDRLAGCVAGARAALERHQRDDGHLVFPLEADVTIPAEYVLLEHFLDRIDAPLEQKIGVHLRAGQGTHGGWPLFHDGGLNLSCSVKAYFALRCIGDSPDAPHMRRAREAILAAGGAERSNVFTRAQLALFGQVPWRAVPMMPLEIMHLPLWFPFHLSKVSYWSRTVIVPLLVLMALKPRARNPRRIGVAELFRTEPARVEDWIRGPYRSAWGRFFKAVDVLLRGADPWFPRVGRQRAIDKAVAFVTERLNGDDGLGGIY
ncbi:MAG TPA: squalene--hopene cyclase, partial [Acetobacteraceae bacterium]|nr:squalene--hopene cyclase [Acetobacteraceae bacterium]